MAKDFDPMIGADTYELDTPADEADGPPSDVQATLQALMREAIDHYEEFIEPDQVDATDHYFARPFAGDTKLKGRSKVVATTLRDAVLDRVPDILEIFMAGDSVVEFRPFGPEDTPNATQQTEYVNYLFFEKNPGFLNLTAVIKDSEVRRLGYLKWRYEHQSRVEGETHTGIAESDLLLLMQDEEVDDYEVIRQYEGMVPEVDPTTGATQLIPGTLLDCEVRRTVKGGRLVIEAVPPEEVVWTPSARRMDRAQIVAHVREVPQDELRLLGIPADLIASSVGQSQTRKSEHLEYARQFYGSASDGITARREGDTSDDSQDPVVFAEAYALLDADGDGIAELRLYQLVGPDFTVNPEKPLGELVSHVPLAVFTPDPEPHTIPGLCMHDHTADLQRITSHIQRAQLDSLSQSVNPQMFVNDRLVNIGDLLSPAVTGFVRVKGDVNAAAREVKTTFVGAETLEVLAYYDTIKGERTGSAGPREGMDPNVLQSTTREAVSSNLTKGQRRVLMAARSYAESLALAFKGILMTLVENKSPAEYVRLRNEWVEVDPRSWHADRDVRITVGLGTGSKRERMEYLMAMAERQEAHIQSGSPIVSFTELRATYAEMSHLMGYRDERRFWRPWGEQEQAQHEQAVSQRPPSDPQMALVEVEKMRAQTEAQMEAMKFQLEQWKAQMQEDRERDKLARDTVLREREIEAKHAVEIEDTRLRAQIEADRVRQDADVKREIGLAQARATAQAPTPDGA
jgi:hypothetical protein